MIKVKLLSIMLITVIAVSHLYATDDSSYNTVTDRRYYQIGVNLISCYDNVASQRYDSNPQESDNSQHLLLGMTIENISNKRTIQSDKITVGKNASVMLPKNVSMLDNISVVKGYSITDFSNKELKCNNCITSFWDKVRNIDTLSIKEIDTILEIDSQFAEIVQLASDMYGTKIVYAQNMMFHEGQVVLVAELDHKYTDNINYIVRVSEGDRRKSFILEASKKGVVFRDLSGSLSINDNIATLQRSEYFFNKSACGYWDCVIECLLNGTNQWLVSLCSTLLGVCGTAPNPYSCGAMAACFGSTGAYCLIDCSDPCTHCDCSNSATSITGRILTESGEAWGGVTVCLADCSHNLFGDDYCTSTLDDGTFALAFDPIGSDAELIFITPCGSAYATSCFTPQSGNMTTGDIVLPDCGTTITFSLGEPDVYCYIIDCSSGEVIGYCQTDNSGTCGGSIESGSYAFAFKRDCECWYYITDCYQLDESSYSIDVELPACDDEICLEGAVVNSNGSNWPNVSVFAYDCDLQQIYDESETNSSGAFSLCFKETKFILVFDPGCCSGSIGVTDCLEALPCQYDLDEIELQDCCNEKPDKVSTPTVNAGEVEIGEEYCIKWTSVTCTDNYEISEDNGTWNEVGTSLQWCTNKNQAGTYEYRVRAINGCGNGDASSPVEVIVSSQQIPHIQLTPISLSFMAVENGIIPDSKSFSITNSGEGTLNWEVSESTDWLSVSPIGPNNSNNATINVSIETTDMPIGFHNAVITVYSNNADNSPQEVEIDYEVVSDCESISCFEFVSGTGDNYPIVITSIQVGDVLIDECTEVAVFDGQNCVGASMFIGEWPLALTAWADDPQTPEKDGYQYGNIIEFQIADNDNCYMIDICPNEDGYTMGDGTFGNGFAAQIGLTDEACCRNVNIDLSSGWNFISLNTIPPSTDLPSIFSNAWSDINIIKNNSGEFCIPSVICNISQWNMDEGYKIHMDNSNSIEFCGTPLNVINPIGLQEGWAWISFYPNYCMDPEIAMASLSGCLNIVKDGYGGFYIPDVVNSLNDMCPGEGYSLHLKCSASLVYPSTKSIGPYKAFNISHRDENLDHFNAPIPTLRFNAVLVISNNILEKGDELAFFNNRGDILGASQVQSDIVPLAVWCDDVNTEYIDGYKKGDKLTIKIWKKNLNQERIVDSRILQGSFDISTDPYTIIELLRDMNSDSILGLATNYPNPFNPTTTIEYTLPDDAQIKITVFNVLGNKVKTLFNGVKERGKHSITWDGTDEAGTKVATGIYFYQLRSSHGTQTKKMLLMR
ncbi:MAG: FlgD immunoglobulin-like domain containing protein [Candidatus Zixiibacteriota bacterium]